MSGAFGWGGKDRRSYGTRTSTPPSDGGFTRAKGAYKSPPASAPSTQRKAPDRSVIDASFHTAPASAIKIDLRPTKKLVSKAANVIIAVLDVTGSMGSWRTDIFKHLVTLYKESQGYLGDDVEILFCVYGDVKYGDRLEVAEFGSGPELDDHLEALYMNAGGGGDEQESPEMLAYYLLQNVDVSSAKHVYTFFVTDEAGASTISEGHARSHLDLSVNAELSDTRTVFRSLLRKMEVFTILRKTDMGGYDPARIRQWWVDCLGEERIMPLDRGNLVVESMLACVAKTTGQLGQFTQDFQTRRGATKFGDVNQDLVMKSVAMVPGADAKLDAPKAKTKLLIPAPDDD